ncbi:insulinase family protein [Paenibacillus sonchi]|uniref:insulinase family protein n=1 Tax=Paenibacillus sonchi TaxID=373687 RepID=UPI001E4E6895|nr:insulinase family protein [Paenibacillus sonchi]MCE3202819.1 insulinase family protein [Paenibacillus sonchi]
MKHDRLSIDENLNIRYMHYITKDPANIAKVTLAVKVGSVNDGDSKGIAHFLEHMLIVSLSNAAQIAPDKFRIKGTTDFDKTLYEISCADTPEDINQAITLLLEIYSGRLLKIIDMIEVRKDVAEEHDRFDENGQTGLFRTLIDNAELLDSLPIGSRRYIERISFEELQAFHQRNYLTTDAHILIVSGSDDEFIRQFLYRRVETLGILRKINDRQNHSTIKYISKKYLFTTAHDTKRSIFLHDAPGSSVVPGMGKIIKDVAFVVLDYCLNHIFVTDRIFVTKLRYSEIYKFVCIILPVPSIQRQSTYENQVSKYLFQETSSLLNKELFREIMQTYIRQISQSSLTRDIAMKELISYAMYNEPIFGGRVYCTMLHTVSYEQVLEQLSQWLNQGEEISIIVDDSWELPAVPDTY